MGSKLLSVTRDRNLTRSTPLLSQPKQPMAVMRILRVCTLLSLLCYSEAMFKRDVRTDFWACGTTEEKCVYEKRNCLSRSGGRAAEKWEFCVLEGEKKKLFFGGGGRHVKKNLAMPSAVESTGGRYEVATEYHLGSKSDDGIQEGLAGKGCVWVSSLKLTVRSWNMCIYIYIYIWLED